jgi:O-antigen/teichoic acid export membrane protein
VTEEGLPAEHGSEPGGLQRRAARGLTWTMVHTWGGQALSLVVFVILARLLAPPDFGLVALAAVFVALAQLVVDQGLGDALIQRREITQRQIDTAFWVAIATGFLLMVAAFLLAAPIAGALQEPDLAPILQVLSVTFVLSALASIPIALLTRELAFRPLAIRAVVSIVGGGVVGIAMAVLGFGAWALVWQQVAAAVLSVITLWSVTPWRPRLAVSRSDFAELFAFGARVVGSDILGFVSRNADNFLIGAFLGTSPLGIYAIGYRILDVSQRLLINVARKITFPVFSRLQHDPARLARAYLRVTRASAVLIVPGYVGLALVAPELTVLVFGRTWAESGPVAAILFLSGPVLAVQAFSGSLLYAAGHPEVVLRFRVITTVANVIGFVVALPFGILAVAGAFTIRCYLFLPLLMAWTRTHAGVGIRAYLAEVRSTVLASLAMTVAVVAVKLLAGDGFGLGALLAVEVAAGAVAFLATLWLVEPSLLREVWAVAEQALPGVAHVQRRITRSNQPDAPAPPGGRT